MDFFPQMHLNHSTNEAPQYLGTMTDKNENHGVRDQKRARYQSMVRVPEKNTGQVSITVPENKTG